MSITDIKTFYRKAAKDTVLIKRMWNGNSSYDDFIHNSVKEASIQGHNFTYSEAKEWMKDKPHIKASGELSDSQLELVVGGKE